MHAKTQQPPGSDAELQPPADHGERSYQGHGRLRDKVAIITGGDSGIGRAVAIAFAREGADVVVSYLDEHRDAEETRKWVEDAGRRCLLMPGDIGDVAHCREIVRRTAAELGRVDILVNNAAFQRTHDSLEEITEEEWVHTFDTNIHSFFYLAKAAVPHLRPGSSIINTSSIQSDKPSPGLLAYATTKGAIANFTAGLGQLLAERGIRVNCVAPGPIWTPLPIDDAEGEGRAFRRKHAAQAARAAKGSGTGVRVPGFRRRELRDRCGVCRHRRHTDALKRKKGAARGGARFRCIDSALGTHVVREHEARHFRTDLLAGGGVEMEVDATVFAAESLMLGELPEAVERARDVRTAGNRRPRDADRDVVAAEVQRQ
jgi:NAD(P)-dependent dehydrogenase (short-subunit alcohol dehydrogenase family)